MLPCVTHGLFIQHVGAAAVCGRSTCVAYTSSAAEPNFFLAREFSQHEQHVSFILTSSILARLEAFGLRTGLRRRNSVFARLERSVYRSEPRQESLTNATNAPTTQMSATNDVSQSEDSANSLIDRSSAAASTRTGARAGELARRHPRALFVTRPARKEWISKREVRRVARVSSNPVIELVITH